MTSGLRPGLFTAVGCARDRLSRALLPMRLSPGVICSPEIPFTFPKGRMRRVIPSISTSLRANGSAQSAARWQAPRSKPFLSLLRLGIASSLTLPRHDGGEDGPVLSRRGKARNSRRRPAGVIGMPPSAIFVQLVAPAVRIEIAEDVARMGAVAEAVLQPSPGIRSRSTSANGTAEPGDAGDLFRREG